MRDDVPVISYFRFMAVEMQFVGAEESVLVLSYGVGCLSFGYQGMRRRNGMALGAALSCGFLLCHTITSRLLPYTCER